MPRPAIPVLVAAAVAGVGCFCLVSLFHLGAGDFTHALGLARDLLAGRPPYAHTPGPYWIPYPLPAGFLALPVAWLPDSVAAGVWFGVSTGILAWGMLRCQEGWRLGMLFSWPFLYAMTFAQWSPLLASVWFLPELAPLALCKPNIIAPVLVTTKPVARRIWWTGFWLAVSLAVRPTWAWEWVHQLTQYQGSPPILSALGPLVLMVLARWRDRRAWFVLVMACIPQRVFYDQFSLLLIAENPQELFFLVVCSWASFFALWLSPDMAHMPGGWSTWVMLAHYLPAIVVVLRPLLPAHKRADR